jgi:N-acetylglutamate synthase-like GNAT family acetyltransferase
LPGWRSHRAWRGGGDGTDARCATSRSRRIGAGEAWACSHEAALALAAHNRLSSIYLLTETADGFFPRFGFRRIERNEASPAVQQSVEFRELCPVSSTVMMRPVAP